MANQIIALCGNGAGCGKDTCAMGLEGWTRISFAEPIRQILLKINPYLTAGLRLDEAIKVHGGWDEVKRIYLEARRLLQVVGHDVGRMMVNERIWVDKAEQLIEAAEGNVVLNDLRYANEALMVRRLGGIVVRIIRPELEQLDHASEKQQFEAQAQIINDKGIKELQAAIREIANWSNREVEVK